MLSLQRKIAYSLSLVFLVLVAAELTLRLVGYVEFEKVPAVSNPSSLREGGDLKILFLGESTTAWGGADAYPEVLGRLIRKEHPDAGVRIINEGIPATDTGKILARVGSLVDRYHPDIAITMMGINDFWAISGIEQGFLSRFIHGLRIYKVAAQAAQRLQILKSQAGSDDDRDSGPTQGFPRLHENLDPAAQRALQDAKSDLQAKRYGDASRVIAPYVSNPRVAPASFLKILGLISLEVGRNEKATHAFNLYVSRLKNPDEIFEIVSEYNVRFGLLHAEKPVVDWTGKALRLDPKHPWSNWALGCLAAQRPKGGEVEGIRRLRIAEEGGLVRGDLYACMTILALRIGDEKTAIAALEKGIKIRDNVTIHLYDNLIHLYIREKNLPAAERVLDEAERALPGNARLADIQDEIDGLEHKPARLKKYYLGNFLENPVTQGNYRSIVEILRRSGVKVMAVQYPVISAEPLARILADLKIPVISNEENFAGALKRYSYDDLFVDRFGGSFGHFTARGSALVSAAILKRLDELHWLEKASPKSGN